MIPKPTKPIIIMGSFFSRKGGPLPCEPDILYNEVEYLSSRSNADRVMTEAFQTCDVTKDVNEQIDEALIKEIERLRTEKKAEKR